VSLTSFGTLRSRAWLAARGVDHADALKMQKPNQGSEKKRDFSYSAQSQTIVEQAGLEKPWMWASIARVKRFCAPNRGM
jgi:hypothetical protein